MPPHSNRYPFRSEDLSAPDGLRLQIFIPRKSEKNQAELRRGAVSCEPVIQMTRDRDRGLKVERPGARSSLARIRKLHLLDLRDAGASVFTGLPRILPTDPVKASVQQGASLRPSALFVCIGLRACVRWCLRA
jgi:hypothetical protein